MAKAARHVPGGSKCAGRIVAYSVRGNAAVPVATFASTHASRNLQSAGRMILEQGNM
jgi:hypothetical protein